MDIRTANLSNVCDDTPNSKVSRSLFRDEGDGTTTMNTTSTTQFDLNRIDAVGFIYEYFVFPCLRCTTVFTYTFTFTLAAK